MARVVTNHGYAVARILRELSDWYQYSVVERLAGWLRYGRDR